MAPDPQAFESSVRQMIAGGKSRTALENAKQFHKSRNNPASEALLVDACEARILSLLDRKMTTEALSLTCLVVERFPSAGNRSHALKSAGAALGGDLNAVAEGDENALAEAARGLRELLFFMEGRPK